MISPEKIYAIGLTAGLAATIETVRLVEPAADGSVNILPSVLVAWGSFGITTIVALLSEASQNRQMHREIRKHLDSTRKITRSQ